MECKRKIIVAVLFTFILIGGLRVWVVNTPLNINSISDQKVFDSVSECAHNQKNMYLVFEDYLDKKGKPPVDINDLLNFNMTSSFYYCTKVSADGTGLYVYKLYPDNYGNPKAVFIEESCNKHSNNFKFWFRGIKPEVKTMGDGSIHLFNDGQVATISGNIITNVDIVLDQANNNTQ